MKNIGELSKTVGKLKSVSSFDNFNTVLADTEKRD